MPGTPYTRREKMNRRDRNRILDAMSARDIPDGQSGLWNVHGWTLHCHKEVRAGRQVIPPGDYKSLRKVTAATLHQQGESVMSDDPVELAMHLEFLMRARGRVLLTGLGLACVLRGLLVLDEVEHIDIVERDPNVIALVGPFISESDRWTLHWDDAIDFVSSSDRSWDFAWHDLWSDRERGEDILEMTHSRLMIALRGRVGWQGSWAYPRFLRRRFQERFPSAAAWKAFGGS